MSNPRTPGSPQFEKMRSAFKINEEQKPSENNNAPKTPSSSTERIKENFSLATTKQIIDDADSQPWDPDEDGFFGPMEHPAASPNNASSNPDPQAALLMDPISLPPTRFSVSSSLPTKAETTMRNQRSQSFPLPPQPLSTRITVRGFAAGYVPQQSSVPTKR